MRTALYMRVSTQEQANEGYSLPSQKRKLLAYCESKGWNVYKIYADEGISGGTLDKRPSANELLEDAKKHKFDCVLIMKVDRLCRNTKDLLTIVEILQKNNIQLCAVDEQIDYSTDVGKMLLTLLGSFAEFEKNRITSRTKEGKVQKVLQGIKSKSSIILYGYNYIDGTYSPSYQEAKTVEFMFNSIVNGKSLNYIAKNVALSNDLNPTNRLWSAEKVKKIIMNPTYKGYCYTGLWNGCVFQNNYTSQKASNVIPIVSEDTWNTANNILNSRSVNNIRKFASEDFVFGDVLYCANCGKKLATKQRLRVGKKRTYKSLQFTCNSRHNDYRRNTFDVHDCICQMSVNTVEKMFLLYYKDLIITPTSDSELDALNQQEEKLLQQLDSFNAKKVNLSKRFVEDLIDKDTYFQILNDYTRVIKQIQSDINQVQIKKGATANIDYNTIKELKININDLWSIMTNCEKKKFVSLHFDRIYISKEGIKKVLYKDL